MLDAGLLDKLEAVARSARDDDRPFGGLQLIFCGTVGSKSVGLDN